MTDIEPPPAPAPSINDDRPGVSAHGLICPSGHPVESGHAFCTQCGTRLGQICPNGHATPPGVSFCGDCGEPLPPPPESEGGHSERGHWSRAWLLAVTLLTAAVLAVVGTLVVVRNDGSTVTATATSVTSAPTTTSTVPTITTTVPAAAVSLQPDGLGVVAFGEVANSAVESVTDALGPPDQDFVETTCPGGQVRFTTWGPLQMASLVDPAPTFVGYSYGSSDETFADPPPGEALATSEGISIGSTLGDLRAAYGAGTDLIDVGFGGLYEFTVDEGPADAIRGMAPGTDDSTPIVVIYAGSQVCG